MTAKYKCSHALEQQLLRWALSGEVGTSSKYMAGVAAFGRHYKPESGNLPGDFGDLRRCVKMAEECESFDQALPEIRRVSPEWAAFVDRWTDMKTIVHEHLWRKTEVADCYERYENTLLEIYESTGNTVKQKADASIEIDEPDTADLPNKVRAGTIVSVEVKTRISRPEFPRRRLAVVLRETRDKSSLCVRFLESIKNSKQPLKTSVTYNKNKVKLYIK